MPSPQLSATRPTRLARARAALALTLAAAVIGSVLAASSASAGSAKTQLRYGKAALRASGDGVRGTLGIATYNSYKRLTPEQARADAAEVAAISSLDVIGWQEANGNPVASLGMDGWESTQPVGEDGRLLELAVSWRDERFDLLSEQVVMMHDGLDYDRGRDRSHPPRYVQKVVLVRVDGPYVGDTVTVMNTHVNQYIEAYRHGRAGRPYKNLNAERARVHMRKMAALVAADESRYTVLLGDFNWDHVADQRVRHRAFVVGRLGPVVASGWEAFGVSRQPVSHPATKRRIDYVCVARESPTKFRSQRVIGGLRSDHRPVFVRLALG